MSVIFNKDNGQIISPIESQGALEGDWVQEGVVVEYTPKEITVENDSISTALKSFDVLTQGDEVRLYNATDGVVSGSLGTTTTTGAVNGGAVGVHDIFGDGSAVATYNLDGNANDLGGNYNGTATNVTYATGKFGQAGVFNGTSSYVRATIGDLSSGISMSCWFKTSVDNQQGWILQHVNTANNNGVFTLGSSSDGNLYLGINGLAVYTITDFTPYANNAWHHAVCAYNGTTFTLYVNNTIIGSDTGIMLAGNDLMIGVRQASIIANFFNGSIDQVRIFNRALTPTEVTTLYNEQGTKYTSDISSLGLTQAPTKAYLNQTPLTRLSIDDNMSTLTPLNVSNVSPTDDGKLVSTDLLVEGDRVIVDGVEDSLGVVTFADGKYSAPLITQTSANPKKVFKIDNEQLTIASSPVATNTTATIEDTRSGLISTGDTLVLDNNDIVVDGSTVTSVEGVTVSGTANTMLLNESTFGSSCIATYTMDGVSGNTVYSGSGNDANVSGSYDGTATNVSFVSDTINGRVTDVAVFDGSSKLTTTLVNTGDFSISCWASHDSSQVSTGYIRTAIGYTNFLFCFYNGNWRFLLGYANEFGSTQIVGSSVQDSFRHFVLVKSGNTYSMYENNGTAITTTGTFTQNTSPLTIGNWSSTGSSNEAFNGSIDQVRIFNRALTAQEVNTLYNEQTTKYQYDLTYPTQPSAPSTIAIKDSSTVATKATEVFDGTKFTWTANTMNKQGRNLQYSLTADTDMVVSKVTVNLGKEQ